MTPQDIRNLTANAFQTGVEMALNHLVWAEKSPEDLGPVAAKEGLSIVELRDYHIRMATAYTQLALACQKPPGQPF